MVLNHINQPGKSGHFDVGYKVLIIHRMHYILFKSTQLERKIATNTHPVDHNCGILTGCPTLEGQRVKLRGSHTHTNLLFILAAIIER